MPHCFGIIVCLITLIIYLCIVIIPLCFYFCKEHLFDSLLCSLLFSLFSFFFYFVSSFNRIYSIEYIQSNIQIKIVYQERNKLKTGRRQHSKNTANIKNTTYIWRTSFDRDKSFQINIVYRIQMEKRVK